MQSGARQLLILLSFLGTGVLTMTFASPSTQAERLIATSALDAAPVRAHSITQVELSMRTPDIMSFSQLALHQAHQRAHLATIAQSHDDAMAQARQQLIEGHPHQARAIAAAIKTHLTSQPPDVLTTQTSKEQRAMVSMLLARAELADHRPEKAVEHLQPLLELDTPVQDYIFWLTAQSYEGLGEHMKAYDTYQKVAEMSASPMSHRARVLKAHMLHEAGEHERAVIELGQVNALYPDYPRRHIALYQYARSLEAIERLDEAAAAYQTAWFEFPYKKRGQQAKRHMNALIAQGLMVPSIDRQARYKRWRRLRINKHWDTARTLFRQLADEAATAEGEKSRMVHEIWQQLALNALVPKRYEEGLYYLEKLREDYEAGHRDGIDRGLVYRYLASTLAKFGELDRALKELDKASSSAIARKQARATFLAEHGRYKRSLALVKELGSVPKRTWSYTWLLYKSNQLTQAHKNFMALAKGSTGRSQAKYLYWAARTKERLGSEREAKELYQQVYALKRYDYYGFQAANRLLDMEARKRVKGSSILVEANPVMDASDSAIEAFDEVTKGVPGIIADDLAEVRAQPRAAHLGNEDFSALLEPTLCVGAEEERATQSSICQIAQAAQIDLRTTASSRREPLQLDPDVEDAYQKLRENATARGLATPKPGKLHPEHLPPRRHRPKLVSHDNQKSRTVAVHDARIFWDGPKTSPLAFISYDEGDAIGPHPEEMTAYGADKSYVGGLERLIAEAGDQFSELERARWLMEVGMNKEARWAIRDVALEFRELSKKPMPRTAPHQLKAKRMTPLIDNRRVEKATWGYIESEYRWPVPREKAARQALLDRQRAIIAEKSKLKPLLIDAMKEVGDYYMVRQFTRSMRVRGEKRLVQLYPRAFPELVIPHAKKRGINPYVIWALMIVESSFNPDSVSTAEALGLLQVIPRTGLKVAELLGEEDFGHYDLLDEDVAVQHGVFYFSQLVRKFHGNELLAMAGYNGGPHRVAEWVDMRGDMPMDEFVEEIPYDQAREYTKKVSRFLHLFMRIYEKEDALYIGNDLKRDWRPMPNF